jgi:hypothetical protein
MLLPAFLPCDPEGNQHDERPDDVASLDAIEASAAWRFAIKDFHRPRQPL